MYNSHSKISIDNETTFEKLLLNSLYCITYLLLHRGEFINLSKRDFSEFCLKTKVRFNITLRNPDLVGLSFFQLKT